MNKQQSQTILDLIDQLKKLPTADLLAEQYADEDLENVIIEEMGADTFLNYIKRASKQLENELKDGDVTLLPVQYSISNDLATGNHNLQNVLQNLISNIETKNFGSAAIFLKRLIAYQIANSFWNKSRLKVHNINAVRVQELRDKLELVTKNLNEKTDSFGILKHDLDEERKQLQEFIASKQAELQTITQQVQSAQKNSEEIRNLLNESTRVDGEINTINQTQNRKLQEIEKRQEEERHTFSEFEKEINQLINSFKEESQHANDKNEDFSILLERVKNESKTFENRIEVLNELIGKEGAVQLFRTFKDRKEELKNPVMFWTWVVIGASLVGFFLILCIFTNFFGQIGGGYPNEIDWQFLLLNSLKSIPIIILIYFTIRQYVRERTFQEEYAFRSTIALTIQAYSELVGDRKDDLIMEAVSNIYSLPASMRERKIINFGAPHKPLSEVLKELNETLKNIKS